MRSTGCTFLLALVLGCSLGSNSLGGGAPWTLGGPEYPPPSEDLRGAAAAILSHAIRLDTSNPPGNERPLAEFLVEIARAGGVEARVIETPGQNRAAAWARLKGTGTGRPVVLLSHLDVVPAEGPEWTVPPFAGIVGGGFVVGRGALDAKGVAVVHLLALLELARADRPLGRDVIFLATPDEEAGGRRGSASIVRDRRELVAGAEFLLTEGGGILPGRAGIPEVWGVTFTEKSPCWLEATTRGPGGHGSAPPREAAVDRLVEALDRVRQLEFDVRVVPDVALMFHELAPLAEPGDRPAFENLRGALEEPEFRRRFLSEPGRAALVRNTIAITELEALGGANIVPSEARARLDARLLPGESCADFAASLREIIDDPEVTLDVVLSFPSNRSPVDTALFRAIGRTAARIDPDSVVVPRVIAGFTDAHFFRDLGIVSYGFVPRRLRPLETRSIHGSNERIAIDNLEFGIHTTLQILRELDQPNPRR